MFEEKNQDTFKGSKMSNKGKEEINRLYKFKQEKIESMSIQDLKTKETMSKASKTLNENKTDQEEVNRNRKESVDLSELDEETVKMINYLNKEAMKHKIKGNLYFRDSKYEAALVEYKKTVDLLKLHENYGNIGNKTNINYILNESLLNLSVCYMLMKQYTNVLDTTNEILGSKIAIYKLKCYLVRSKAFQGLSLYGEAVECLKQALSIRPTETLLKELEKIETKIKSQSSDRLIPININSHQSKYNFIKILRILLYSITNFFKNNKFLCFILGLVVLIELKNGISSVFSEMVQVSKFHS